ncbi:MAG: preprotein translocase subunit SecG [Candidatus Scalindua sp.]|nr:preprotein translocase subunit SecG [Candidatus Scalindua sp.]
MKLKWIVAIVIIFGSIAMFFVFQWSGVLKSLLVLSSIILIGVVLLQSGKGGGLAAIGGFSDQSAFGTKTGTFLSKITYLVGASFIFTTILLTKLTLTSIHGTGMIPEHAHEALQQVFHGDHDDLAHDEHEGHDHEGHDHANQEKPQDPGGVVIDEESMGMKGIDAIDEKKEESKPEQGVEEEK